VTVEVLLFASLAERAGTRHLTVRTEPGWDVAALWSHLLAEHPGLAAHPRPLAACDRVYARWDRALEGVREVAFLPPVSGG
jgi:molybdopterin synthase catalytic subunit